MFHKKIKALFHSAVSSVVSGISQFTFHLEKDLTRSKKLPANTLLRFLVSQGASSTRTELLDFFGMDSQAPSASALNHQRAKLKATALGAVFLRFNDSVDPLHHSSGYRFLAVDGSSFTFFSAPRFASPEYFVSEGHSAKGFYSMHLTALYDMQRRTYADALLQPVHKKDEFRAFCTMADRQDLLPGTKNIYIGDRTSVPGTVWPRSGSRGSTSYSVQKTSFPKALPPVSISRRRNPLISPSVSPLYAATRKRSPSLGGQLQAVCGQKDGFLLF